MQKVVKLTQRCCIKQKLCTSLAYIQTSHFNPLLIKNATLVTPQKG